MAGFYARTYKQDSLRGIMQSKILKAYKLANQQVNLCALSSDFGIDSADNLTMIAKAMLNPKFIKIMKECQLEGTHRYSSKAISLFRKDFWKEFI